ncbi:hypothetical protein ACFO9Q_21705 [Paenibacillus sp. GCM10023252]|uniref:hypothetical protein n=1 Tax=Paenibacillus sp. GCM10023252 TaxID=3252649 RepID=UPI00360F7C22
MEGVAGAAETAEWRSDREAPGAISGRVGSKKLTLQAAIPLLLTVLVHGIHMLLIPALLGMSSMGMSGIGMQGHHHHPGMVMQEGSAGGAGAGSGAVAGNSVAEGGSRDGVAAGSIGIGIHVEGSSGSYYVDGTYEGAATGNSASATQGSSTNSSDYAEESSSLTSTWLQCLPLGLFILNGAAIVYASLLMWKAWRMKQPGIHTVLCRVTSTLSLGIGILSGAALL